MVRAAMWPNLAVTSLRRCVVWGVVACSLLLAGGLRHHLVWGESAARPWQLPLLNGAETACLVGFVALAGRSWWRGMQLARDQQPTLAVLMRLSWPLLLAAIVVPPFLTSDPIDYVVRGRVLAVHGANPYVVTAAQFAGDPFLAFGDRAWKDFPLPYGPVVANVQAAVAWLADRLPVPLLGQLIAALLLLKVLFAGCVLGSAWLLARVVAPLRPGAAAPTFVAIAWNPLLLGEGVANAHNEPLVLLCLAIAAAALARGRVATGLVALGLGALTKVVPVVLGPVWLVHAVRQRALAAIGIAALVLAGFAAVFWWQFFHDPQAFDVLARQAGLHGASLWWALDRLFGTGLPLWLWLGRAIVIAVIGAQCVAMWRRPTVDQALRSGAVGLAAVAIAGPALFGVWYHIWWLPFALAIGHGYVHRLALVASVTSMLGHVVWTGWRRYDDSSMAAIVVAAIVVPLLVAACWRGDRTPPPSPTVAAP
jgi:hypothetical protein